MAASPIENVRTMMVAGAGGAALAVHEMGDSNARPVMLIHGYFSNAFVNWIRYGHAKLLAERGFRVIMPDLRGHGYSARPHDAAAYPPDILMRDGLAIVARLGLADYDLGGYSLGARTAVRMLANGARPRRLVISGMGLEGLIHTQGRGTYFRHVLTNLGSFERGTPEWMTEAFLKTTKGDPEAMLRILDTFVDTPPEAIAAIVCPTLVVTGIEDDDNGSSEGLVELLPDARLVPIPGNHMSAVMRPELGQAIADFLGA